MSIAPYLDWLRTSWKIGLDPSRAEERPAVDPPAFRAVSPLGGTLHDHGTEMTLHVLRRRPELLRDRIVWEVGCGEGIIAVTCALSSARDVWASDVDAACVEAARRLAERNRANVRTAVANLLDEAPFEGRPDLLVANLPQKPVAEGGSLTSWEDGGPDGTRVLRPFVEQAAGRLAPGGEILMLVHSLPHPSAIRRLQERFETELLGWRRRLFEPTDYYRKLKEEGTSWFEEDAFIVMQVLARRRRD